MSKRLHRISSSEPHQDEGAGSFLSPEIQERPRKAAELLREWMTADDGYDEEIWPLIEEELANSRTRVGSGG